MFAVEWELDFSSFFNLVVNVYMTCVGMCLHVQEHMCV